MADNLTPAGRARTEEENLAMMERFIFVNRHQVKERKPRPRYRRKLSLI